MPVTVEITFCPKFAFMSANKSTFDMCSSMVIRWLTIVRVSLVDRRVCFFFVVVQLTFELCMTLKRGNLRLPSFNYFLSFTHCIYFFEM